MTITSATAPAERRCADAKVLTLDASGKATVKGDTEAAINEFLRIGCGSSTIFDGPQVYYRVALKQGKVYQIQLSEAFSGARFYLFEGASCTAESIETSCSSEGKTGLVSDTGGSNGAARLFRPAADGDYTIAVDSGSETAFGAFQLSIEEVTPPANATCDSAEAVALTAGAATIKATTFAGLDEYGAQVSCGGATPLDGPQVYYRPAFETGKTYELTVSSSFTGRIYGFGSNCDATQIEVDCSSHGATGFSATTSSQAKKVYFTASGSGPWTVALDSSSESQSGEFELSIAEFPVAANGSCAAAQQVTLSSGQATQLDGDTTAVLNEFGTTINCGGGSTSVLDGPQVYYQVSLVGGTTYQLTITPTFFGARLYLAQAGCDTVTINADCASKGQTGLVSNSLQSNKATTVEFTPQSSGDYLVVVDSAIDTSFGRFSLTIAEKAP